MGQVDRVRFMIVGCRQNVAPVRIDVIFMVMTVTLMIVIALVR